MLLIIMLVLLLVLVQAMIPGQLLTKQVGAKAQMGSRDNLPEPNDEVKRANRALGNLHETLPIFLTVAVLAIIYGEQGALPIIGGVVYLLGRIAHVICYMAKLSPWRSISFTVALVGILMIVIAVAPHIWS